MKIAIASGKGGTGKTFISVHLAASLAKQRTDVTLLDCDVEARNDHLFIKPEIHHTDDVILQVPEVNTELCTFCGTCAEICEFNALAVLPSDVLVFQELCHACGGCTIACPTNAIKKVPRSTGQVYVGSSNQLRFVSGSLNIGEAKSPPVIKAVQEHIAPHEIAIIDSPPGTSCPTVESVRDVDIVMLVAEPTPFGLYDLQLVIGMLDSIHKKYGVIINKDGIGNAELETFCQENNIPVLLKIPFNKDYNEHYAEGKLLINDFPEIVENMSELFKRIEEVVS